MEPVAAGCDRTRFSQTRAPGRVLREHQAGEHARALGQEGRQAGAEVRVHQPVVAPLGQDGDRGHGRAEELEREGHGHALEVGPGQDQVLVREKDGVVGRAVELDLDHVAGPLERVARRADDLGRAAEAVGVLDLLARLGQQLAPLGDPPDVLRRLEGAGVAAGLVEPLVVGDHVGVEDLEGHGRGDLGHLEPAVDVVNDQGRHAGDDVRAVDHGQAVPGVEDERRDAGPLEGLGAGQALALVEGLALAHGDEGHLGHRRKVAAGADRALLAHHGGHALVEELGQGLGDDGTEPGVAVAVAADPAEDGRPDDLLGHGLAVARGVAVDEIALVFLDLVLGQDDIGQLADAGVDPVHDLVLLDLILEQGPALFDAFLGRRIDGDGQAVAGHFDDGLDGQTGSGQIDRHGRSSWV